MSDTQSPCPTTGFLLGDQDRDRVDSKFEARVDEYFDAVVQGHREAWLAAEGYRDGDGNGLSHGAIVGNLLMGAQADVGRLVMECERCGRLHVQVAPNANRHLSFALEKSGYRGVLRRSIAGTGDSGPRPGPHR